MKPKHVRKNVLYFGFSNRKEKEFRQSLKNKGARVFLDPTKSALSCIKARNNILSTEFLNIVIKFHII